MIHRIGLDVTFSDGSFDAVLCNLGLMFFPDPVRGLSEFRRVLRPGGHAAVLVNTVVERSYNHQINVIIARHVPSLAEAVTRTFVLPSFDAYYGPFERGGASTGQALAALPEGIRRAVREQVRRDLVDTGGPIEAEAPGLTAVTSADEGVYMFPSPTRMFLTKGVGVHRHALTAFEFALRDADIEQQNLVFVSSLLPPRCEVIARDVGIESLKPGDITFCVLARSETNEFGRHVYASLGLARPADPDMYGFIGAARIRHDRGGERRTG